MRTWFAVAANLNLAETSTIEAGTLPEVVAIAYLNAEKYWTQGRQSSHSTNQKYQLKFWLAQGIK